MLFQPIVLVQSQPETIGVGQDNTTKTRNNHKEGNGYYHQKDCVNEHKKRKTRIVKENDKGFFQTFFKVVLHEGADGQKPLEGKYANEQKPKHHSG